jgi:23S rRNA pseudouridine1911/1915/1917 synthase
MPSVKIVHLQVNHPAARLDQYLSGEFPEISRSQLKKLIRQGQVLVSDQLAKPSTTVQPGDLITLHLPRPQPPTLQPESLPLDVIFEDDDLIVINKATGMVVHPAHGHAAGTLVNALLAHYPDLAAMTQVEAGSTERPGIVHRLDRDTSGLILVARTPATLQHLRRQFKTRAVEKIYLALVFGQPPTPEGVIDVPLGRDPHHRQRMAPQANGKSARTHYRVLESLELDSGVYSLLEIGLETGRTHQIRVHLAWLKCPVVGDQVYGRRKNALRLKRQFLHAWQLRLAHPRSGEVLHLEAPLDKHLQSILDSMRQE